MILWRNSVDDANTSISGCLDTIFPFLRLFFSLCFPFYRFDIGRCRDVSIFFAFFFIFSEPLIQPLRRLLQPAFVHFKKSTPRVGRYAIKIPTPDDIHEKGFLLPVQKPTRALRTIVNNTTKNVTQFAKIVSRSPFKKSNA